MKRKFLVLLFTIFVTSINLNSVQAQYEDPSPEDPGPMSDTPVDGGISLLLAAGAAYGVGRLRRRGRD
jgi:hypothetical protein